MLNIHHIPAISGGKDSDCLYMLTVEYLQKRDLNVRPICMDTGNEHEATLEHVATLHERLGGPKVEILKADFTDRILMKRETVKTKWVNDGVADELIQAALNVLHPTGNPFLDMCIYHGRFPSKGAKFCTPELKVEPTFEQVVKPLLVDGQGVCRWVGVRRQESKARSTAKFFEKDPYTKDDDLPNYIWRPIVDWDVEQVFALHRKHGLEPNPLYKLGCKRVGCMPCIEVGKDEIRNIVNRFPDHIQRIAEWERIASQANKKGQTSFFSFDKIPGRHHKDKSLPIPDVNEVARWSQTGKGGFNYDLVNAVLAANPPKCSSHYGLCE